MSDGESTTSAPSVDPSARFQARAALVTALVALVSAVLGPLVSLRINGDQIDSQQKQNLAQNEVDREASESEFVRTERRAVYADYLAAFNNGALDLTASGGRLTSGGYPTALAAKETEAIIATLRDVTSAYYAVSLLVSPDAQDEAAASFELFSATASELLTLGARVTGEEAIPDAELTQANEQLGQDYADLITSSRAFIDEARDDLRADLPTDESADEDD